MKKLTSVFLLILAFTLTANSQPKREKNSKENLEPEQAAILAIKKMTLHLDLSEAQQNKIKPLIKAQMESRSERMKNMREKREKNRKLTKDERFKLANTTLDEQIDFQKKMKSILNPEQFEKFKEAQSRKKMNLRRKMNFKKMQLRENRE